ncbi:MAG: hypothetical protein Q9157_007233 [Trypethelium eluteriae]
METHTIRQERTGPNDIVRTDQSFRKGGNHNSLSLSRPKSRCFVYDCENVKLTVETVQEQEEDVQKIPLKRGQRHITLFVNPDTVEEEGRTDLKTETDPNHLLFATLDLRGEGLFDKFNMMTGRLNTLCVKRGISSRALKVSD